MQTVIMNVLVSAALLSDRHQRFLIGGVSVSGTFKFGVSDYPSFYWLLMLFAIIV